MAPATGSAACEQGPHTMLLQLQAPGTLDVLPRAEGVLKRAAASWTALLRCCWRLHPSLLRASMACGTTWVQPLHKLTLQFIIHSSNCKGVRACVWLVAPKIVHTISTPLLRCPGGVLQGCIAPPVSQ